MKTSEEEKAMWLEDWRRSGKTAWTYAKENGLVPQTFTNWTKSGGKTGRPLVEVTAQMLQSPRRVQEMLIEKGEIKVRIPLPVDGGELRMIIEALGRAV